MAGSIKGIIVEIGGDTSGLQKALSKVNSATSSLSKELKQVNSLLKLDPKNTELLKQKQEILNGSIKATEDKLKQLQKVKEEADKKMAEGTAINEENYRALQREIIKTQTKLSDLKNENSGWNKAGNYLVNLGEELDKISNKINDLGNKLTTRLTVPITAIATAGIVYNAEIEKYTTAFETFLGDAKEAEKVVNDIKNNASKTPFDTASLIQANQMLVSTGENAQNAQEVIMALGDAITATGGGNAELTRMAANLQQVKNAGKATALDIKQFAYAGIDIYGLLANYTGKTTKEIKEMDVSYEVLTEALKKANKQGGKYFNAMNKASETLAGQTNQLKAQIKDMTGELTKSLMPTAKKIIGYVQDLIKKFNGLSDSQKENIIKMGLLVAATGPFLKILSTGIGVISKTTKGIGTFTKAIGLAHNGIGDATGSAATLAKVFQKMTDPIGLATTLIGGAVVGMTAVIIANQRKATEETRKYKEECEEAKNKTLEEKAAIDETKSAIDNNMQSELEHIEHTKTLWNELKNITDENGKVKEGYEQRAKVITGLLSDALGTEITMTGNVIDKYRTLQNEIDKLIIKKQSEVILAAAEEKYNNAMKDRGQKTQELIDAQEELNKAKEKENELYKQYKEEYLDVITSKGPLTANQVVKENWENQKKAVAELEGQVQSLKDITNDYTRDIEDYYYKAELAAEGTAEAYQKLVDDTGKTYIKNGKTIETSYANQIKAQQTYLKDAQNLHNKAVENNNEAEQKKTQTTINESKRRLTTLIDELKGMTSTVNENSEDVINSWKALATDSYDVYVETIKELPPEMQNTIQAMTGVIVTETPKVEDATNGLADKIIDSLDTEAEGRELAINMLKSYLTGLNDEQQRRLLKDAGITDAEEVIKGLNEGNLSEEAGINILKGLRNGLDNQYWKNQIFNKASSVVAGVSSSLSALGIKTNLLPGYKEGLDYVPYDNYIARLHKGERVLTAEENKRLIDMEKATRLNKKTSMLSNQIKGLNQKVATANITFNVQKMDKANLDMAFNYINRRLGTEY